jgi:hypothetical protein
MKSTIFLTHGGFGKHAFLIGRPFLTFSYVCRLRDIVNMLNKFLFLGVILKLMGSGHGEYLIWHGKLEFVPLESGL